ncbi:MAG: alpha-amylase family glycosyl hydrolase [bacterium]
MRSNKNIYEINTRVWIKNFSDGEKSITLDKVPNSYWDNLADLGIDFVWLMGVWKTCRSTIEKYCFEEGLVKEYNNALKDWKKEDVIGSPYSINVYEISPELGGEESLILLKQELNKRGIKLILDFVSNHYSADSVLLRTNSEIFLTADQEIYSRDQYTYFKPFADEDLIFAHGRDPFFPAWQDTAQVNYFSLEAREYQINLLKKISNICDGLRCDMAMLTLNNVFINTWGGTLNKMGFARPETHFWQEAITAVKVDKPDFVFLAEVYWDLEWELQQLGFDYTYDKKLIDKLHHGDPREITSHLYAEPDYQERSCRFIENHDEPRAVTLLGKERAKLSAVLISTITGLKLYNEGQFEGKKIKLPVQLGREPKEVVLTCMQEFYTKLLHITRSDIFRYGDWHLVQIHCPWEGNITFRNLIAYEWRYKHEKALVVLNFANVTSTARIKLDVAGYPDVFELKDLLNDINYTRTTEEAYHTGVYIELKSYRCHIFVY